MANPPDKKDMFDRIMQVVDMTESGNTWWMARFELLQDMDRLGIKDHIGLAAFMDEYETYAKATGTPKHYAVHELMDIREYLTHGKYHRQFPLRHGVLPQPDTERLKRLHDLILSDSGSKDITEAVGQIIYRDLDIRFHGFLQDIGVFLAEHGKFDMLVKETDGKSTFVGHLHGLLRNIERYDDAERAAQSAVDAGFRRIFEKTYADKDYFLTLPKRYITELVEATDLDQLDSPDKVDIFWRMAERVGWKELDRNIKKAEALYRKEKDWEDSPSCEGGGSSYHYARLVEKRKKILEEFNRRSTPRLSAMDHQNHIDGLISRDAPTQDIIDAVTRYRDETLDKMATAGFIQSLVLKGRFDTLEAITKIVPSPQHKDFLEEIVGIAALLLEQGDAGVKKTVLAAIAAFSDDKRREMVGAIVAHRKSNGAKRATQEAIADLFIATKTESLFADLLQEGNAWVERANDDPDIHDVNTRKTHVNANINAAAMNMVFLSGIDKALRGKQPKPTIKSKAQKGRKP